jgi:tetratricopeptide (TPR) repeat protein
MSEPHNRYRRPNRAPDAKLPALLLAGLMLLQGCNLSLSPDEYEAKGDRLLEAGKISQAVSAYSKVLNAEPDNLQVQLKIAEIQESRGFIDEAIERYQIILDTDPTLSRIRLALVRLQVQKGMWRHARENLEVLSEEMPREAIVYKYLAQAAEHADDWDQALSYWQIAEIMDPDDPSIPYARGKIYVDRGQFQRGATELRRSLAIDPGYTDAHFELGLALIELDRIDEAERSYRLYIDRHPREERAYYLLGNALLSKNYTRRAIEQYERAISINPGFSEAHFNLGFAYMKLNQISNAREAFQQAIIWADGEEMKENARRMLEQLRRGR